MQEQVKATFLVNAAVLLEFRGTKLLIDGIYDENGHCFSNLSERQWEKLKAGEGEFAGIEYLLFTHEHGDHFSPQRVAEYLEYRQPKAIFMPRDGSAALRALQKKAEGMGIPCVLLHRELCRKTVFRPEQEIRIRAFQTRQLDKLLFTADVDFTQEDFSAVRGMALDAVFVNPLMSHSEEGKALFAAGVLQTKTKIVYHIPFAGEDKMMIRKIVEQEMRAGRQENALFFMEEGQTCLI